MSEIFGDGQDDRGGVELLDPSVPRAQFADGSEEQPRSTGKLQAGSHARIYRDGHYLVGTVLVPVESRMSLRHLPPGTYVLRDECENQVGLRVGVDDEDAVVYVKGGQPGDDDGTAEPGSARLQPQTRERNREPALSERTPGFPNVGPDPVVDEQIEPKQVGRKKFSPEGAESDAHREPGAAGSARITPEKDSTTDEEIPDDAAKGVVAPETEQGEDDLDRLAITEAEQEVAESQKAEKSPSAGAVDPEMHTKDELRGLAKSEGVAQGGTKDQVAARINAQRGS